MLSLPAGEYSGVIKEKGGCVLMPVNHNIDRLREPGLSETRQGGPEEKRDEKKKEGYLVL